MILTKIVAGQMRLKMMIFVCLGNSSNLQMKVQQFLDCADFKRSYLNSKYDEQANGSRYPLVGGTR